MEDFNCKEELFSSMSFDFLPSETDDLFCLNIFRHVSLRCGLRTEIPALTVNRLCGSGFQSIVNGVQDILVGDAGVVMTGGTDNMSACPYAVRDIRFGTK